MILDLTDDYRVTVSKLNFVLEERRPRKKGGFSWTPLGYYSGLRGALHALPDFVARSEKVTDLQSLMDELQDISRTVARRITS